MIPFIKLFSLVVRIFARPMITRTKYYHLKHKDRKGKAVKQFFISLGHKYHNLETTINR